MTVKFTQPANNSFTGVLFELSNGFVAATSDVLSGIRAIYSQAITTIEIWRNRKNQRNHLMALNSRQLDDIGLNRGRALIEASKPFWRA